MAVRFEIKLAAAAAAEVAAVDLVSRIAAIDIIALRQYKT